MYYVLYRRKVNNCNLFDVCQQTEWDHFLENAQKQMSVVPEGIHNPLELIVGSQGPCDLMVKNARTGL